MFIFLHLLRFSQKFRDFKGFAFLAAKSKFETKQLIFLAGKHWKLENIYYKNIFFITQCNFFNFYVLNPETYRAG